MDGLPSNTHGGQVGEAYLHGVNGIAEGGATGARNVDQSARRRRERLVTAGTAVPTSRPRFSAPLEETGSDQ